jgi:uncharacterized protein YbjT (DUF2867 family)
MSSPSLRRRVAIAGGSGFVGRALAAKLAARFDVVGVARRTPADTTHFAEFRAADLFNLREAEAALEGVEVAVYLVHSMLPSARLTQGHFADFDLLCADNFARAAQRQNVKQIVYLGGLLPEGPLSPHLESRREVERALASRGVPVTVLRAGLVLGGGGSSFHILSTLARRLPVMLCPKWMETRTQVVALDDVLALLEHVIGDPSHAGETYDVGAPETISYSDLMKTTAELLGVRRLLLPVPFFSPGLSRLWISLITGAPGELVGPLVESLRHEMVARDLRLAASAKLTPTPTRVALTRALAEENEKERKDEAGGKAAAPTSTPAPSPSARRGKASLVRSVQRMRLPAGKDAAWAADEYASWLPRALSFLIRAEVRDDRSFEFFLLFVDRPLLVLTAVPDRSTPDRQLFFVTGGWLVAKGSRGRFELRQVLDERTLLTAIHDFAPSLPWWLYRQTQARFHAWVMAAFAYHLRRS